MTAEPDDERRAEAAETQYRLVDPLETRIRTHRLYSEHSFDIDVEVLARLRQTGRLMGLERLLDIGCGSGSFWIRLRESGHEGPLLGLDRSRAMIDAARNAVSASPRPIDWVVGEANRLPFPDDSMDGIAARHMLYHLPDISGALREFRRVLRRDGWALFTTNSGASLGRIHQLNDEMRLAFGLPAWTRLSDPFNGENAEQVLGDEFRIHEKVVLPNALVFDQPEPIVDYVMTLYPDNGPAGEEEQHDAIRAWFLAEATRRLKAMEGRWRDPKDYVVLLCD